MKLGGNLAPVKGVSPSRAGRPGSGTRDAVPLQEVVRAVSSRTNEVCFS